MTTGSRSDASVGSQARRSVAKKIDWTNLCGDEFGAASEGGSGLLVSGYGYGGSLEDIRNFSQLYTERFPV